MKNLWNGLFQAQKKRSSSSKDKERVDFEKFVKKQLVKLKERGLSVPVATL